MMLSRNTAHFVARTLALSTAELSTGERSAGDVGNRAADAISDADHLWGLLRTWDHGPLVPLVKALRDTLVEWREAHSELAGAHASATQQLAYPSYASVTQAVVRAQVADARVASAALAVERLTVALRDTVDALPAEAL